MKTKVMISCEILLALSLLIGCVSLNPNQSITPSKEPTTTKEPTLTQEPTPSATPPSTEKPTPILTFTFKDGTCFYEGPTDVNTRDVNLKLIIEEGNQDAMDGVAVVTASLRDDKTIDDLEDWSSTDQPPWLDVIALSELFPEPMEKEFSIRLPEELAYFVCFHPTAKIGTFGPIEVQQETDVQNTPVATKVRVAPTNAPNLLPIVIDTDMAVDDWMAILYLLNRSDVDICGITVTGAGEAHCYFGVNNALKLIDIAGRKDIPVACGRETPLVGDHSFPEEWREFVDSFAGQKFDKADNPNKLLDAVGLLGSIFENHDQKVTILTLGPLTNIAELLRVEPQSSASIEEIFIMGGAVQVPGNIQFSVPDNKAAEWNIYVDPVAASEVFSSGVPITLVPLDATNLVPLDLEFYNRLEVDHPEPEASFVFDVLTGNMVMIQSSSYYFWDPLAAAIMVNESFATVEPFSICVETNEGITSGATQIGSDCPAVRVVVDVDADMFKEDFIETLNAPMK